MKMVRGGDLSGVLRKAILSGEYSFGARLKIDEIARKYGVSHMPVRDALLRLEGEALVTIAPHRGATVRAVDIESASNSYDIVVPLEALMGRRAAGRMTAAALARITRIEQQLEAAAEEGDLEAAFQANIRFHQAINEQAGNPEAAEIVDRRQEVLRAFRRIYGLDASRLPGVVADHRSLIHAFENRDADGAAAIAAGHAARARCDLFAVIRAAAAAGLTSHQAASPGASRCMSMPRTARQPRRPH